MCVQSSRIPGPSSALSHVWAWGSMLRKIRSNRNYNLAQVNRGVLQSWLVTGFPELGPDTVRIAILLRSTLEGVLVSHLGACFLGHSVCSIRCGCFAALCEGVWFASGFVGSELGGWMSGAGGIRPHSLAMRPSRKPLAPRQGVAFLLRRFGVWAIGQDIRCCPHGVRYRASMAAFRGVAVHARAPPLSCSVLSRGLEFHRRSCLHSAHSRAPTSGRSAARTHNFVPSSPPSALFSIVGLPYIFLVFSLFWRFSQILP